MRNVLREKRGEGYIDIAVGILCLMLVIALAVSLFPVFMVKQQLIYLILAHLLKISTFRARRAILSVGRQKKKAKNSDAAIMELAVKLSPFVPMDAYKRRKLVMVLHSAGIKETPEVYLAQAYVKSGLVFFGALPCLAVIPILAPAFLIMGIGVLFSETGKAEKTVRDSREAIEYELPRFVATITQELLASREICDGNIVYQAK